MTTFYVFGLLALGLVLITLEVFIPSLGMLGILAAASIIGGGVLACIEDPGGLFLAYIIISFVLIPTIILTALKMFPKTPLGKHFTVGGPTFNPQEARAVEEGLEGLNGLEGETYTQLHPTGIARINNRRVDVVTRGEIIEKDTAIRVVKIEGNRVVVEASEKKP